MPRSLTEALKEEPELANHNRIGIQSPMVIKDKIIPHSIKLKIDNLKYQFLQIQEQALGSRLHFRCLSVANLIIKKLIHRYLLGSRSQL
jgi:hypothetical protein